MRIAITGSTGFIGGHLVQYAARRGCVVLAVKRHELATCSFRDVHAIVHLAGIAHRLDTDAAEYMAVNCELATTVAKRALDDGVERFIYVSSVAAMHPVTPYGQSKAAAEQMLLQLSDRVTVVRPPLVYGRNAPGNFGALVSIARLPIPLPFADAGRLRSLVFVENLCDALLFLGERGSNGMFVVTDGEDVSLAQIVSGLRQALGRKPWLFPAPWLESAMRLAGRSDMAEKLLSELRYDSSAIRQLGWTPPVAPTDGLRRSA